MEDPVIHAETIDVLDTLGTLENDSKSLALLHESLIRISNHNSRICAQACANAQVLAPIVYSLLKL